jgi:hypothetical protein
MLRISRGRQCRLSDHGKYATLSFGTTPGDDRPLTARIPRLLPEAVKISNTQRVEASGHSGTPRLNSRGPSCVFSDTSPKRVHLRQGFGGHSLRIPLRLYNRGFLRRRVKSDEAPIAIAIQESQASKA